MADPNISCILSNESRASLRRDEIRRDIVLPRQELSEVYRFLPQLSHGLLPSYRQVRGLTILLLVLLLVNCASSPTLWRSLLSSTSIQTYRAIISCSTRRVDALLLFAAVITNYLSETRYFMQWISRCTLEYATGVSTSTRRRRCTLNRFLE